MHIRMHTDININIWIIIKIMIRYSMKRIYYMFRLIRYTFIILYLKPLVSDGWRLTIHMYILLIYIRLFVMQMRYAVWVTLTVATWYCELRLIVDGSFFIMLVHPRPIMQRWKREKLRRACAITFPTKAKKQLFLAIQKYRTFRKISCRIFRSLYPKWIFPRYSFFLKIRISLIVFGIN